MVDFQQNFLASLQGGLNIGQQARAVQNQNRLSQLASQAYSAPADQRQGLLSQIASVDPRAAQQQEQAFASTDDRRNTTMVNMAKLLTSVPEQARAQLWQRFVPTLSQYGLSDLPSEYNAQTAPIINQAAQSLVQAYGGGTSASGVQSTYVDNNGQRVAIMRDGSTQVLGGNDAGATQRTLTIDVNGTPTQVTFDSRTGRYSNASLDGQAGGQPTPGQQPQGGYQNINGQATYIDPSLPPQVQQQILQSLANGQEPPAQMAFAGQPGAPLTGRRAEDQAAAVERAKIDAQNSNFETEIEQQRRLAEQQARIEGEKARAVQQAKSESERAETQRAKSAALNNVTRGVDRVEKALTAIEGMRGADSGPLDQYFVARTKEGQELAAAVGAMQDSMLALTRVPGVGSQSDLEAKLANLKYPDLGNYPTVNRNNVAQLKALVNDLRTQFGSTTSAAPAGNSGPQPGMVEDGYRFRGGNPSDPNNWERI